MELWPKGHCGLKQLLVSAGAQALFTALVVSPQWRAGLVEPGGEESSFPVSSLSLHPLEGVRAQPGLWVQEPIGRTHLDGAFPNDLAQLGNVVVLLDGCPQVPVIIRLDCCWFTPKSSLGRGDISRAGGRHHTHMHTYRVGDHLPENSAPWPVVVKIYPTSIPSLLIVHPCPRLWPWLTWVRVGLFHRSAISLRFSGRSSSCSAWAASSMFRQKGSSHTGLAL